MNLRNDIAFYVTWYMTDGRVLNVCNYGHDVGNLHVIDYYLHKENFGTSPARAIFQPALRFAPDDWTRYDGDLL